jgi:hypothetical protein
MTGLCRTTILFLRRGTCKDQKEAEKGSTQTHSTRHGEDRRWVVLCASVMVILRNIKM